MVMVRISLCIAIADAIPGSAPRRGACKISYRLIDENRVDHFQWSVSMKRYAAVKVRGAAPREPDAGRGRAGRARYLEPKTESP